MDLEGLRAFLAVAEHRSFAGAASALGVARTSLRRHVDALEVAVGMPLLERGHTGVVLTDAGKRLLASGRGLEREFAALVDSIRDVATTPAGLLRILAPVGLPPHALEGILMVIRTSWPELRLRLRFSEDPMSAPLSDIDVVVAFSNAPSLGGWHTQVFASTPLRLLASRGYLERHPAPTTVDELVAHPLLAWTVGAADPLIMTRQGARIATEIALATSDADLLHNSMRRGIGIAWVPDGLPQPSSTSEVVRVLDGIVGADLVLQIATPQRLAESPRAQVFFRQLEMLRQVALSIPG